MASYFTVRSFVLNNQSNNRKHTFTFDLLFLGKCQQSFCKIALQNCSCFVDFLWLSSYSTVSSEAILIEKGQYYLCSKFDPVSKVILKMATEVKLPDISSQSIYAGKYKDWSPALRPVSAMSIFSII